MSIEADINRAAIHNGGEPAFPRVSPEGVWEGGMTKRELMAALMYASRPDLNSDSVVAAADRLLKALAK
jgi:hypothetical protein